MIAIVRSSASFWPSHHACTRPMILSTVSAAAVPRSFCAARRRPSFPNISPSTLSASVTPSVYARIRSPSASLPSTVVYDASSISPSSGPAASTHDVLPSRRWNQRLRVARACHCEPVCLEVRVRVDRGYEVAGRVAQQPPVHSGEHPPGVGCVRALSGGGGLDHRREHRGRHPVPGDVGDEHSDAVLARLVEVVDVSADGVGGHAACRRRLRRYVGRRSRQQAALYRLGGLQFGLDRRQRLVVRLRSHQQPVDHGQEHDQQTELHQLDLQARDQPGRGEHVVERGHHHRRGRVLQHRPRVARLHVPRHDVDGDQHQSPQDITLFILETAPGAPVTTSYVVAAMHQASRTFQPHAKLPRHPRPMNRWLKSSIGTGIA